MRDKNKHSNRIRRYGMETPALFGILAVICLVLYTVLMSMGENMDAGKCGLFIIVLYIIGVGVGYLLIEHFKKKKSVNDKLSTNMGRIMFEAVLRMDSPVFICDGEENIVWNNKILDRIYGKDGLYGAQMSDIFGVSLEDIMNDTSERGTRLEYDGKIFYAKTKNIKTDENDFSLVMTTEATELDNAYEKMRGDENVVMYIMIDNLSEIMQYDSDNYRPLASKVDETLRAWSEQYNCILKEFERDKYILVTQVRVLDEFTATKFDILDEVRKIRLSDTSLPLTVSIGVGNVEGTFEEKDRCARMALELALQRGGDQAVVKSADTTEYFGGMTNSVQKRTNVKARVISTNLIDAIRKSSNVLIMGHKYADFDAFGSCVGLARLCMFCERRVNIVSDLKDMNLAGCRELLDTEEDFLGVLIDSHSALDLLGTGTLVIMTDVNNLNIVESRDIAERAETVCIIDHHRKTSEYRREPLIEYIEPSASSACELVAEMLEQVLPRDEMSQTEATLMLSGIMLDTKNFITSTGTRTFSAALYLRDRGALPTAIRELSKTSLDDYMREGRFRTNVEFYRKNMAITITEGSGEGNGPADRITAAKAANNLLDVTGVEASFALVKIGDMVNVSARSAGKINVQLILEKLKGGGHFDAAGAQLSGGDLATAVSMLKDAIDEYCTETMVQSGKN